MSGLLGWLDGLDRSLFLLLNRSWTGPFLDAVMPVLTDPHRANWILYGGAPALLAFWFWRERRRALQVLVVGALAVLVAYSRVYCGVHFPGDVLAGLAVGALIGVPWARLMLAKAGGGYRKKRR